ncbi:hypothetical protein LJR153_007360 [Paenibacillus sp. LjRoot153]|uniref:hypothetical protein n=1 Tax=Paenibacillus sp. LjRoot153 TaxID=3342270 RepID=UPI003ECDD73D
MAASHTIIADVDHTPLVESLAVKSVCDIMTSHYTADETIAVEPGTTIELHGTQCIVKDWTHPKRFLVENWMGSQIEISKSLLKPDGKGIIVFLYNGGPDSLSMTVQWNGISGEELLLEEETDPMFYHESTLPDELGYEDGLLFRIQELSKFDSGNYISKDYRFSKEEAIDAAEVLLQQKYRSQ